MWIQVRVPRLGCTECGRVRQAEISFAPGQHRYTKRFARYVVELARRMTIWDVAQHLDVSWNLVKTIVKSDLERRFARPRLRDLKWIAIDEISIERGHRYLTVVLDLESGAVVFVGEGKGAEALDPFWKRLRCSRAQVEAVAIDMSQAYINAVEAHLPEATLVFDRFHVVKLMNDKLSDLRRELQRETEAEAHRVLKGTRWLLLKSPDHLDAERDEAERLHKALDLNAPLAAAYYLQEELRQLWNQPSEEEARPLLESWIKRARATGLKQLRRCPTRSPSTARACSPTTTSRSRPGPWTARTPRSSSSNARPTAFAIRNSSSSKSTPSTRPAMNSSDELQGRKQVKNLKEAGNESAG